MKTGDAPSSSIVWARGRTSITSCPTSYVTSESMALLEEFYAWKLLGSEGLYNVPARVVDGIFVLESELRAEGNDGQH